MVTCGRQQFNMLPMAPINPFVVGLSPSIAAAAAAAAHSAATKPKIGFSIDSIVGGGSDANARRDRRLLSPPPAPVTVSHRSESPDERDRERDRPPSAYSDDYQSCQQPLELRNSVEFRSVERNNNVASTTLLTSTPLYLPVNCHRKSSSVDRSPDRDRRNLKRCRTRSPTQTPPPVQHPPDDQNLQGVSPPLKVTSPPPTHPIPLLLPPPPTTNKGPIIVPGIPAGLIRPLAMQAPNLSLSNPQLEQSAGPMPAPPPNPHFLAAQFQMAAAIAHHHHQQQQQQQQQQNRHQQHQHQQQHPGQGPPCPPIGIFPPSPHHPQFATHHQIIRDSYPLYPWLLSRHGRIFPHRFPGNFLLQPFRKPKRVRTAFSPTQLLKLEHAFEGNHYVVGAERKQLAQGLGLTETQVKVWFQNRRTKHKRMQQEGGDSKGDGSGSGCGADADSKNDSSQNSFDEEDDEVDDDAEDEDEVIDMDDYASEMDTEEQQIRIREQFQQQLSQHHQLQQLQQHQQQQQQQHQAQAQQQLQHQQQQQQQLANHPYFLQHQQQQ